MITRAAIIAETLSWTGTPYRHQASLKGAACDCLGLVRGVYRFAYGNEPEPVPAYAADWAEAGQHETLMLAARRHLVEIPLDAAAPADVLIFRWRANLPAKHCAILVDTGRMVHAYDGAGQVCETNLTPAWRRMLAGAFAFPDIAAVM